eukprot:jgi/Bigna1/89667/estExt_fgenesh1_pg.C_530065
MASEIIFLQKWMQIMDLRHGFRCRNKTQIGGGDVCRPRCTVTSMSAMELYEKNKRRVIVQKLLLAKSSTSSNVSEQIMHLFAPLKKNTKDDIIDDLKKMRDRDESIGCLPTVYITAGIAPELSAELKRLRAENSALRDQLKGHGFLPVVSEDRHKVLTFEGKEGRTSKGSKLKKISSFHKLPEIKTPMLAAQTTQKIPPLDWKTMDSDFPSDSSGQTVEIEIVKHLQQGTGLLKKMRWSAPKIRVFRLSKNMQYLQRESLNFLSFAPTRIHLNHITAMEHRTSSTTDPELAEAGFCIFYDLTNQSKVAWKSYMTVVFGYVVICDNILYIAVVGGKEVAGLQLVLEHRAKSTSTGAKLKAELLELTLKIPVTSINHWYVHHFPNGCMTDGEESL